MKNRRYAMRSALSTLACSAFLLHCGGPGSTTKVESGADQNSAVASADPAVASSPPAAKATAPAASEKESPRQAAAKLTVRAFESPDVDLTQRGRLASAGLAEGGFGLPAGQLKAFEAIPSPSIDPSQCAAILGAALAETAKPLVEKRCGSMDALRKRVAAAAAPKKARDLMTSCKISDVDEKDPSKLNPWAVLASAIVLDELAADPQSNDDEKKIAKALAHVCRLE